MSEPTNVHEMLEGRATRYGTFEGHARISQALKRAMQDSPNREANNKRMRDRRAKLKDNDA